MSIYQNTYGALSVVLNGTSVGNTGSWNNGYVVFGPGAGAASGSGSAAVSITYNTSGGYGALISLSPNYSWNTMNYYAASHSFYVSATQAGYVNSSGFVNGSDKREKINIKEINTAKSLQRILACTPKTFQRVMNRDDPLIPDEVKNKWHIGLIAQEVLSINPHCISEWKNEAGEARYGINYTDFVTHLIGSVKELSAQLTQQNATIATLQSNLDASIASQTATANQLAAVLSRLAAAGL